MSSTKYLSEEPNPSSWLPLFPVDLAFFSYRRIRRDVNRQSYLKTTISGYWYCHCTASKGLGIQWYGEDMLEPDRLTRSFWVIVFGRAMSLSMERLTKGFWLGLLLSLPWVKIKGIFKGFKYIFNNFAVKERELEIGCPTDVKHVAHIGWDGPSGDNASSWMNQFKKVPDFAAASIGNSDSSFLHAHLRFFASTHGMILAHPSRDV
ncbi:hypothetical protein K7X08_016652 [Anisodus acutangulus]|uniref:CRIB domain-containing protein n=1 Tax=Anisodus acutangulus TaxID=402998 RepID=A0A9Q1LE51_9SOLA|nr:hypothetical protein K7X08_016652 [Anisodus acutangulus]